MPTIPAAVGERAGQWDQQNVDVASAAQLVANAETTGFSAPVKGAATAFSAAWHAHLDGLAADAEEFADDLRAVIKSWFDSDAIAQDQLLYDLDVQSLHAALVEQR